MIGERALRIGSQRWIASYPLDSGSLVVGSQNRAAGLLLAGSEESTIFDPIKDVISLLKVDKTRIWLVLRRAEGWAEDELDKILKSARLSAASV
jgi:hypothetical protein